MFNITYTKTKIGFNMRRLFGGLYFNRLLLSVVLSCFTITNVCHSFEYRSEVNLEELNLIVRIKESVEKLVKSEKKGFHKIVDAFVEVKEAIEIYNKYEFDTDYYMRYICQEIRNQGVNVPKKEMQYIANTINKKEKIRKKNSKNVSIMMQVQEHEIQDFDSEFPYLFKHKHKSKDEEKEKEDEEVNIPSLLIYGVTISLCGVFLMTLPIPVCKDWGTKMVIAGIAACSSSICAETDKNKKDEKDKNR